MISPARELARHQPAVIAFADSSARSLVKKPAAAGVNFTGAKAGAAGGAFKGLIVITGTLPTPPHGGDRMIEAQEAAPAARPKSTDLSSSARMRGN